MTEEPAAYRSRITTNVEHPVDLPADLAHAIVVVGPLPSRGPAQRPGPVTDATDPALAALRDAAVLPVVRSLLTGDELEQLQLSWGAAPHERDVWVHLVAGGEDFTELLHSPDWDVVPLRPHPVAERLADHLQDWICETAFGWGQWRPAAYTLPAA